MPKHSLWPDGSYPTYINPTFDELLELVSTTPDIIRIMGYDEDLAIASGHGNTHESVSKNYKLYRGLKHAWGYDYILYNNSRNDWFFNMMGHTEGARFGDDEKVSPEVAIPLIGHEETLQELVKLLKDSRSQLRDVEFDKVL